MTYKEKLKEYSEANGNLSNKALNNLTILEGMDCTHEEWIDRWAFEFEGKNYYHIGKCIQNFLRERYKRKHETF